MKKILSLTFLVALALAPISFADQEITITKDAQKALIFVTLHPGEQLVVNIEKESTLFHNTNMLNKSYFAINPEFEDDTYYIGWSGSNYLDYDPFLGTDEDPMAYHFTATAPGKTIIYFSKVTISDVSFLKTTIGVTVTAD